MPFYLADVQTLSSPYLHPTKGGEGNIIPL